MNGIMTEKIMINLSQLIVSCGNCGWIGRTMDVKPIYHGGEEIIAVACPDCSEDKDYNFCYTFFVATKEGIELLPRQFKYPYYRLN